MLLKENQTKLSADQQENVETILSCGNSLLETMNSILSYVKLEASVGNEKAKDMLIVKRCFQLKQFFTNAVQMFKPITHTKDIDLNLHFNSKHDKLYCDSVSLRTVLTNLLSNSCKFTKSGGKIDVSVDDLEDTRRNNKCIQIHVKDTGIGIAKEFAPRVFSPFEQQDCNIHREYGGTGLGLAISKHIVELLDGTIRYQSEENKGTTFTVTLPVQLPPVNEHSLDKEKKKEIGFTSSADSNLVIHQITVLVCDDNSINIKVFDKMLTDLKVKHVCVSSGPEAIEELKKNKYDLLLLDIEMPIMSGLECANIIRGQEAQNNMNSPLHIYYITGYDMCSVSQEYMSLVNGFVQKPLRVQTLSEIIYCVENTVKTTTPSVKTNSSINNNN